MINTGRYPIRSGSVLLWTVLALGCSSVPQPSQQTRNTRQVAEQRLDGNPRVAGAPIPPGAGGLYDYLVSAGFSLSPASATTPMAGAELALSFTLAEGSKQRQLEIDEYPTAADAKAMGARLAIHRFAAVCGPLVLSAQPPLPRPQVEAGLENALDIYVARAQSGLLSADNGSQPVHLVRKMFMLSRDSAVYSHPSADSPVITVLQEDSFVRVIDLVPNFLKVRLRAGQEGFISEHAVE